MRNLLLVSCFALLWTAPASTANADDLKKKAQRVHRAAIVVDTHIDTPDKLSEKWADLATRGATDHFDLPRAREGGLTAPFFSVYVAASYAESGGAARRALELIDLVRRVVGAHPRDLVLAVSAAEIRRAKKDGRIGVLMGIEGGHAIEDSLAALREFHRAGVRYMTLTHTNTNHWADSSGPFYLPDFDPAASAVHHGLSDFGREVVREMNRIGMIVDISHVSDETLEDVLETSRAPVMASHSSCRAIADMPRNLTDGQIQRIAAVGGIVMINFGSTFLDQGVYDAMRADLASVRADYDRIKKQHADDLELRSQEIRKLLRAAVKVRRTSWTRAVDHIEHVIRLAGPEAVGIGSDFDGVPNPPEGLDDVAQLPRITEELLRRGHSEEVVRNVLGANFLRFFERVQGIAQSLGHEPARTVSLP